MMLPHCFSHSFLGPSQLYERTSMSTSICLFASCVCVFRKFLFTMLCLVPLDFRFFGWGGGGFHHLLHHTYFIIPPLPHTTFINPHTLSKFTWHFSMWIGIGGWCDSSSSSSISIKVSRVYHPTRPGKIFKSAQQSSTFCHLCAFN